MKRIASVLCSLLLVMSLFPSSFVQANSDQTRVATIEVARGDVKVFKAGGKLGLKAYEGMKLISGDVITTGADSGVILRFSNGSKVDDEIALNEHTKLSIYKVKKAGATLTKTKVNHGQAYFSVSSIEKAEDEFVVEVNGQTFDIRGTHFTVEIDPNTGLAIMILFSGTVTSSSSSSNNNDGVIYPAQQVTLDSQNNDFSYLSLVDIEELLKNSSPEVVLAIIKNLNDIKLENEELIKRMESGDFKNDSVKEIEKYIDTYHEFNIDLLVTMVAKKAVELGKITEDQIDRLIAETLNNIDRQFEGGKEPPEVDRENELSDALKDRKAQIEEQRRQQEELAERAKRLKEEQERKNQEARNTALQQAQEAYINQLSAEERERFLREREERERNSNPPVPAPTPTPSTPPDNSGSPPDPSDKYAWDGVTAPFNLYLGTDWEGNLEDAERLNVVYDASANVYRLEEPITYTGIEQLWLEPNSYNGEVTVNNVKFGFENMPSYLEDFYNLYISGPRDTPYELIYRVTHEHYGAKTFVVKIEVPFETIEWDYVQPLKIQAIDGDAVGALEYHWNSTEGVVSIDDLTVNDELKLVIEPSDGFEISNFVGATLENGVYTVSLEDVDEESFTLELSHPVLDTKTIEIIVNERNVVPYTLLKGWANEPFENFQGLYVQWDNIRQIYEVGQRFGVRGNDEVTEVIATFDGEPFDLAYDENFNIYYFDVTEELIEKFWSLNSIYLLVITEDNDYEIPIDLY